MVLPDVLIPVREPGGGFRILEASPSELAWPDLQIVWKEAGVELPICFAPPEEKLDLFFSYACKAASLPISLGTVFNPSWTELFLSTIRHDCLVISEKLLPHLTVNNLFASNLEQLKLMVVVGCLPEPIHTGITSAASNIVIQVVPNPVQELAA